MMKEEDYELDILLGEISDATSSFHHHQNQNNSHVADHGYYTHGHASSRVAPQRIDINRGWCDVNNTIHQIMYDDECLLKQHNSPVSGFSLQSDGGSSSSLFSGGGPDFGSPSSPQFEDFLPRHNGFSFDFKNGSSDTYFTDYFDLSRDFTKMHITNNEQKGVPIIPPYNNNIQYRDQFLEGAMGARRSLDKYEAYKKGFSDFSGLINHVTVPRKPINLEEDVPFLSGQSDNKLFYHSHFLETPAMAMSPQLYRDDDVIANNNNFPMGFMVPDVLSSSSLANPSFSDTLIHPSLKGINLSQLPHLPPSYYNEEDSIRYNQPMLPNERHKAPLCASPFAGEDSFIIHGEVRDSARFRGRNAKTKVNRSKINDGHTIYSPPPFLRSKCSSLAAAQGNIYHIAKDQNGCRFLQRIFEEGTSLDVHLIFVEIIDHAVELMMNPFGNYLMQKLLEVCSEEQRMHVLLCVTKEPMELVRVSLNTHGTRVVQKLIETVKTKQQISLIIEALEPGFLTLVKDLNGNHVIKRCLQCFPHEDRKFIFVGAAKYCVEMATHQYGCCVLQRSISHSTSEHLHNLVAEISANALLLAQDAFGNYVVQFILELKVPNAISKITSQFEGNYIHLSTQKFSSHVVEMCIAVCNEEIRSKIIRELLSATYFDQLLQDPHANYVVQKALRFSQGYLHNCLVHAIESYKVISRNSPYSKRFYSHKLLKR